jgi:hypothetical protein
MLHEYMNLRRINNSLYVSDFQGNWWVKCNSQQLKIPFINRKRGCFKRNQICHIEFIEMFTDLIPTDCYISTSSI